MERSYYHVYMHSSYKIKKRCFCKEREEHERKSVNYFSFRKKEGLLSLKIVSNTCWRVFICKYIEGWELILSCEALVLKNVVINVIYFNITNSIQPPYWSRSLRLQILSLSVQFHPHIFLFEKNLYLVSLFRRWSFFENISSASRHSLTDNSL